MATTIPLTGRKRGTLGLRYIFRDKDVREKWLETMEGRMFNWIFQLIYKSTFDLRSTNSSSGPPTLPQRDVEPHRWRHFTVAMHLSFISSPFPSLLQARCDSVPSRPIKPSDVILLRVFPAALIKDACNNHEGNRGWDHFLMHESSELSPHPRVRCKIYWSAQSIIRIVSQNLGPLKETLFGV